MAKAVVRANGTAGDGETRRRADRGQRLAPEAQRRDVDEVARLGKLAGRMALDGERQGLGPHAAAVVRDLDPADAALQEGDRDAAGPGVDRVLHQLLHGGGRPLHHLAGSDAVYDMVGQEANRRHPPSLP